MQQDGYPVNSGRFIPDSPQLQQYQLTDDQQVNVSAVQGGMQQPSINVYPATSNLGSGASFMSHSQSYSPTDPPQPLPYWSQINPTMGGPAALQNPYQNPQTTPYPNPQHRVSVPETPARPIMYQRQTSLVPPSSPLVLPGAQSISPRSGSPRKSITGMMSPIRVQNQLRPPTSPVVGSGGHVQAPASPLSVYMSTTQAFQRPAHHSPRHAMYPPNQLSYNPRVPQSPQYHQGVQYTPPVHPQHSPVAQFHTRTSSAPPSPRYLSPALNQTSPVSVNPHGISAAGFQAARQLDLSQSFPDPRSYSGGSTFVPTQLNLNPTPPAPKDAWNDVSARSVVSSLPVLSSDTLDLLSTLMVSTVNSPVRSQPTGTTSAEPHMQRSPLLQQHLLMPKPPIKVGSLGLEAPHPDAGTSLPTQSIVTPLRLSSATCPRELGKVEEPPSRSNHMHNVKQRSSLKTEEEKRLDDVDRDNLSNNSCTFNTVTSIVSTLIGSKSSDAAAVSETVDTSSEISQNMNSARSFVDGDMAESQPPVIPGVPLTMCSSSSVMSSLQSVSTQISVVTTTVCNTVATSMATCVTSSLVSTVTSTAAKDSLSGAAIGPSRALPPEVLEKRSKICEAHKAKLKEKLDFYNECLTELFFLQNGGNCMDFIQFKKRPSHKLVEYLKKMTPDSHSGKKKHRKVPPETMNNGGALSPASDASTGSRGSRKVSSEECKRTKGLKSVESTHEDKKLVKPKPLVHERSLPRDKPDGAAAVAHPGGLARKALTGPVSQNHLHSLKGSMSPLRLKRLVRHNNSPSTLDDSIGSQEEILERAKQEAVVQRKVVELRKQGLWTQRRLPKVQEPPRNKTHWDYLLEEMRWLSADFAQERKWKRAAARKLVRTVSAYHKEQHDKVIRAEREEQNRLRRIAATMAREIRMFWGSIGKVVEYKQRSLLDEKRQKALDLHLSYIVDQTEKYSDWLTQGLNKQVGAAGSSPAGSLNSSKPGSDDEFLPQGESSDDEETIAVAERELEKSGNDEDEISILQQESQLPFDELLNSLPPELIENIGKPLEEAKVDTADVQKEDPPEDATTSQDKQSDKESEEEVEDSDGEMGGTKPNPISLRRSARKRRISEAKKEDADPAKKRKVALEKPEGDDEFNVDEDSEEDDEATVEEEEMKQDVDHEKEIKNLQAEGEMPIEELMKMYAGAFNGDDPEEESDEESKGGGDEQDSSGTEESDCDKENDQVGEEIGMDYLFKADATKDDNMPMIMPCDDKDKLTDEKEGPAATGDGSPSKEITDVAAEAASLQPTGFTLATTQVVTPIPVLLKHTLREYQHIGLDWLVTMYDKRLNGILADEMGLGKTIQTIALLAHLACEKGVWGPHLIVVPTSVMLNWEMEFKKWCPGFKILTYYGSQKERKAKRTGWTKSNAFHVCITSYKLVLQDNVSFRRKKWKYLVLDEAQNIKNFKSQRWQTLLNFNSQRRLLLTGTPLQNNLMELWSLMHFLMPHVFQSHKEFKEWFSNPLTGMIEGNQEYNEKLVRRLHKVLRPFLLRRIKKDVEKQMPNKYEHVVRCHLSKRQRFLYEDFMSRAATKDTLTSGHFMSVINVLMQLRKVCNHPNLFEPRSIISPFMSERIVFNTASLVTKILDKDPFETLNLQDYHLHLPSQCNIHRRHAGMVKDLQTPRKLIEELDCGEGRAVPSRPSISKSQLVKEQLGQLLKERERQKSKSTAMLSLHLAQGGTQQLPVLTLPVSSSGGTLQLTTASGARVITIPQSKSDGDGFTISGVTAARGGVVAPQGFTLQYQTPQGTKVTIPNKQIRHLPGGMVQIVTSGMATRAPEATVTAAAASPSQSSESKVHHGPISQRKIEVEKSVVSSEMMDIVGALTPSLYSEVLKHCRDRELKGRLARMANVNENRCEAEPSWLSCDTIDFLKNVFRRPTEGPRKRTEMRSDALLELIKPHDVKLKESKPMTDRFVFMVPKVDCVPAYLHVSHPAPSAHASNAATIEKLQHALIKTLAPMHSVRQAMRIQFPEARLIQYDCGKLQVLDVLLRRFWREKHRCLVFTQMTKVLDILEAFLSYHGYRYLRLDGSTRVEQRMSLMERFNNDPRIFCFILSTRSGGVGVNLTGADTVIFYDSDWNPTMDAQAQDRCHRIGQTRDVHIYRLISERTVEENILKKANQKRLLGELAIEGGSFTTAFFKEQAIQDLFNEPTGLEDIPSLEDKAEISPEPPVAAMSRPITARQKAIAAAKEAEAKAVAKAEGKPESKEAATEADKGEIPDADKKSDATSNSWEDALQQTEDKEDVDAAKLAKEEQDAEMEEFTENADGDETADGPVSRVQEELRSLYEELTPVEQYALRYLEETTEEMNREELEIAEEQVHQSKKDWEITHLMALKEEEERRLEEEEDEIFYTREDAENQVYIDDVTGETMPVWFPPTPPQDENDVYIDPITSLLYQNAPMHEDQLPVINVKKERKRMKTENESSGGILGPKRKILRAEIHAPKSLFNRPLSHLKKRDSKSHKFRTPLRKVPPVATLPHAKVASTPIPAPASADKENVTSSTEKPSAAVVATSASVAEAVTTDSASTKSPDWLINEDWKLLQAVQQVLEMPLSLVVMMPAHTPNWDLVADIVNSIGSVYRSPKMCKQRFENVIAPREEGRTSAEISLKKKLKGTKTLSKLKSSRPQKTTSMHLVDNNLQHTALYSSRFDAIKETCAKRTQPMKSSSSGQFQRNPKHTSILMENGIAYDKPLPPVQVASLRAERIAREKQALEAKQQLVQSQSMQQHPTNLSQITASQVTKAAGISTSGVSQLTAIPLSGGASNIIVNSSALSALTKKMSQQQNMAQFSIAPPKPTKATLSNTALQQTLLRSASGTTQAQQQLQPQIQIQQQNQVGTMVTVGLLHRLSSTGASSSMTTAIANSNTITLSSLTRPSITVPAGAFITSQQQIQKQISQQLSKQQQQQQRFQQLQKQQPKKTMKPQITPQRLQITPEAMKQLRKQQQLEASVVTVTKFPGKQRKTPITQQELEQLLAKNPSMRRSISKAQTTQVQIAPAAQIQAQQVQVAAAQQAAQQVVTSKPLPITVPVSNLVSVAAVNLGVNIASSTAGTSGQPKQLQVPMNIQQHLFQQRQQVMKQRLVPQQQQQNRQGPVLASKVGGKQTVYAMVTGPPLVQNKRRLSSAVSSAGLVGGQQQTGVQQPVQLTVTKLLQSQAVGAQPTTHIKQAFMQQGAQVVGQQMRTPQMAAQLQQQQVSATIVPSSTMAQHRLITPQRQIRQIQQLVPNQQMILTQASSAVVSSQQFQQRQNQSVVASISIPTVAGQITLSSPTQQTVNLSQQSQNVLQAQMRTQSQGGIGAQQTIRTTSQQPQLVLSQVAPQTPIAQLNAPATPTTMTLAPSLVQLPMVSVTPAAVGSQSQPLSSVPTGSTPGQYVSK